MPSTSCPLSGRSAIRGRLSAHQAEHHPPADAPPSGAPGSNRYCIQAQEAKMVIKLEKPVNTVMELSEYKEFVDANVDILDYDCICETAWALKALANNRKFFG